MTRLLHVLVLAAVLSACSFDVGKFDDRRCQSELACRPDETCQEGLCAQEACTTAADCGPGYQYACEVGGCVVAGCTGDTECALGYSCMDGYCAMECTGADADLDGVCDPVDNCVTTANRNQTDGDGDLIGDACDTCPQDAENDGDGDSICGDLDNCPFITNTSQLDRDGDGMGNECDADDDADGQIDTLDLAPLNPDLCGDSDDDTCDDCAIGTDDLGPLVDRTPSNDGADADSDGACDAGDLDDDNDGIADLLDPATTNPDLCGDNDADTCDDCAVGTDDFGVLADNRPAADGTDADADGQCDTGDPDDDNDLRPDVADTCPTGVTGWISSATTDVDLDGCRDAVEDCNTCAATCGATCTDGDSDGQPDCLEQYCGADPLVTSSTCVLVGSEAAMNSAVIAANGNGTPGRDFILIETSYTMAGDPTNITGNDAVQIRACAGATITVDDGLPLLDTNRVLFEVTGDGNVFDGILVTNIDDGYTMFLLGGDGNVVRNSTITSYERTGVMITGADNTVLNNVIAGGTAAGTFANAAAIMVNGNNADRNRIISNVLVQTAHDGIRVLDADELLIDHNTIAGHAGDAISFVPGVGGNTTTAANLCVRNNILANNQGAALRSPAMTALTFSTACELSLTGGLYGNDQVGNGGVCAGTACTGCACLAQAPVGGQASFFEYSLPPAFTSTTFGDEDFFCVAEALLIDAADVVDGDLVTVGSQPHDLNGREPGDFVPQAPDIGGREDGAEGCY